MEPALAAHVWAHSALAVSPARRGCDILRGASLHSDAAGLPSATVEREVQPGDLVPTLQPARTKGTVHLKHGPLPRPEHSDSFQCAVQRQKPDLKLKLWISLEEKASTTALFCSTSYPGNGKAEFTVFLWLTRFEFIPPRSTGRYMNLQAHLGRKMPPHLFKLNFCAARHAEFMALKGRAAEEPNSLSGNKNNCVSRCVNRILCAHSTLHWHWREKVIQQIKGGFFFPWWGT